MSKYKRLVFAVFGLGAVLNLSGCIDLSSDTTEIEAFIGFPQEFVVNVYNEEGLATNIEHSVTTDKVELISSTCEEVMEADSSCQLKFKLLSFSEERLGKFSVVTDYVLEGEEAQSTLDFTYDVTQSVVADEAYILSYNNRINALQQNEYDYNFYYRCSNKESFTHYVSEKGEKDPIMFDCPEPAFGEFSTLVVGFLPNQSDSSLPSFSVAKKPFDSRVKIDVKQWGSNKWQNVSEMFGASTRLIISADDNPDFSILDSMARMFFEVTFEGDFGIHIADWDVSTVKDMSFMFYGTYNFGEKLSVASWDVSSVENMGNMFNRSSLNVELNAWNVSNVQDMSQMFEYASTFNLPISDWDVSNVINMRNMFFGAKTFDQELGTWDVSRVTDMTNMFNGAELFNQPLNEWNVSSVTDMTNMFSGAELFNQPLNEWNVGKVRHMRRMFGRDFNQSLNSWNVSNVIDMSEMFAYTAYNHPLNNWDVSNVKNMSRMFSNANSFNRPLDEWDVSNVEDMSFMFLDNEAFYQDLSGWNVENVLRPEGRYGFAQGSLIIDTNYMPVF